MIRISFQSSKSRLDNFALVMRDSNIYKPGINYTEFILIKKQLRVTGGYHCVERCILTFLIKFESKNTLLSLTKISILNELSKSKYQSTECRESVFGSKMFITFVL